MIKSILTLFFTLLFSDENDIFKFKSVKELHKYEFYGKKFEYDVYWGFIKIGNAVIEVSDVVEVSTDTFAYKIVSRANSSSFIENIFKVKDVNIGYLDVNFKRSYGYYKDINEGKYKLKEYTVFDYKNKIYYGEKVRAGSKKTHNGELKNDVYDVLSSLFLYLRKDKQFKPKTEDEIDILTTKIWKLKVINYGVEKIKIDSKRIKVWKLEPKVGEEGIFVAKKGRSMYVYISQDRIPILLEAEVFIGNVYAKLTNFQSK